LETFDLATGKASVAAFAKGSAVADGSAVRHGDPPMRVLLFYFNGE
jgi:hypothetical protein